MARKKDEYFNDESSDFNKISENEKRETSSGTVANNIPFYLLNCSVIRH